MDIKKKPVLNKLERRAKFLRDNLKKRKAQQVKRRVIQPMEAIPEIFLETQVVLNYDHQQKQFQDIKIESDDPCCLKNKI